MTALGRWVGGRGGRQLRRGTRELDSMNPPFAAHRYPVNAFTYFVRWDQIAGTTP